jgi:hypothetical protein
MTEKPHCRCDSIATDIQKMDARASHDLPATDYVRNAQTRSRTQCSSSDNRSPIRNVKCGIDRAGKAKPAGINRQFGDLIPYAASCIVLTSSKVRRTDCGARHIVRYVFRNGSQLPG